MDILYYQTTKLLLEVQQGFERLEKVYGPEADSIEKEVQARIDQATRCVCSIEINILSSTNKELILSVTARGWKRLFSESQFPDANQSNSKWTKQNTTSNTTRY